MQYKTPKECFKKIEKLNITHYSEHNLKEIIKEKVDKREKSEAY